MIKYLFILMLVGICGFSLEYQERWVCHSNINLTKEPRQLCVEVVVLAKDKKSAEILFDKYLKKRAKELNGVEMRTAYSVFKMKELIIN